LLKRRQLSIRRAAELENTMRPFRFNPADHEDAIAIATEAAAKRLTEAFLADQPATKKLILDCLGEALADDNTLAEVARRELAGEPALGKLLADVIHAEAEPLALQEVEATARARYADYVDMLVDITKDRALA
jgi:hypothetical protein